MRKIPPIYYIIFLITIDLNICISQPYIYFLGNTTDSTSLFIGKEIMRMDLKTGNEKLFLFNGYQDFNLDPLQKWLTTGFPKLGYTIYSTQDTMVSFHLPAGLVPEDLLSSDSSYDLYLFCQVSDSGSLHKELVKLDTKSGIINRLLKVPEVADENNEAFLSEDQGTIFFTIPDSNYNWGRADKIELAYYSKASNEIIRMRSLSEIGQNNADGYNLYNGRKGMTIIESYIKGAEPESFFRMYNFDADSGSNSITFQGVAVPYLLDKGDYIALAQQIVDTLDDGSVSLSPSGTIGIYDLRSSKLLKTLNFPPQTAILFYDQYPDSIYPLGTSINGIVKPIDLDSVISGGSENLHINLLDSRGTRLAGGSLQYYDGSWKDATNNGDGTFGINTTKSTLSLRMTYAYGSQTVSNVPAQNNTYIFQTKNVAVQLSNSLGNLIDTGTVQYYAGAWRDFGTTTNGVANKELLPNNYSFRMTYANASIDKQQDVGSNPTVVFQTVKATIQLQNSQGNLIDQGTAQYYAGAWRDIGSTSNGKVSIELLPKSYSFRMTYEGISNDLAQDIGQNSAVTFSTILCTITVQNSQNQPVDGADIKYYAGEWREIGQTVNGQITKELLPKNISFRMTYNSVTQNKSQDISTNNIVQFNTGTP